VVLAYKLLTPTAVLLPPVVLARKLLDPTPVL
jgi:hypothetical protein